MESDRYALFTECHRLYVQGIRRALRERLESAYGDGWFQRGVLLAITDKQRENLKITLENRPVNDLSVLLDAIHFGRIVRRNHAAVFADVFTEIDAALERFRFLASVRNEWAHIQPEGLPLPRVISAIQAMKGILLSLRCREAVEIDSIMVERNIEQPEDPMLEPIAVTEDFNDGDYVGSDHLDELTASPLELWRTLQSYLVMESFVEHREAQENHQNQDERQVVVTIRVSNTAPDSEDRPYICFRNVSLSVVSSRRRSGESDLGYLEPGQTVERQFNFHEKEIAQFEFRVSGSVDPERFFRVERKGGLPGEVIRPLLSEFMERFEAIGIKEPMTKVLASVTAVQPTMTLADASRVRTELGQVGPIIEEKLSGLNDFFREFHLNKQSPLGYQCNEIAVFLNELNSKIQAVDNAIGGTNLEAIKLAVNDLEQLQLSVLQVEETIRKMINA